QQDRRKRDKGVASDRQPPRMFAHGIPLARERFLQDFEREATAHIAKPEFGTPQQRNEAMRAMPGQVAKAAQNTIEDAVMTADAACIVFAHSMVDGAVENYCAISAAHQLRRLCLNNF